MTTERRLIALLAGVSVLAGGFVTAQLATAAPLPIPVVAIDAASESESVTIQFLGDTMLGDAAQPLLDQQGYGAPFENVADLLDGDIVIANAESPITDLPPGDGPQKRYNYAMQPAAAAALRQVGVDVLQLGNNHVMDRGVAGLADTQDHAQRAGLVTFGAGSDLAAAQAPLLISSRAGTIAVVGFGESFGAASTATASSAGIPVVSRRQVDASASHARAAGADIVIATVHWGDNYQPVNEEQRRALQYFANAGYDAVVGTGPHIAQPIEVVDGMPVLFSIGNFVFGTPGRFESFGAEGDGLVASFTFHRSGARDLELACIRTDNDEVDFRPRPCTEERSRTLMTELHPQIQVAQDGTGRLRLAG